MDEHYLRHVVSLEATSSKLYAITGKPIYLAAQNIALGDYTNDERLIVEAGILLVSYTLGGVSLEIRGDGTSTS